MSDDIDELKALLEEIQRRFPDDGACLGIWSGRIHLAVDANNAARAALAGFEAGMRVKFLQAYPLASREAKRRKAKQARCQKDKQEMKVDCQWVGQLKALADKNLPDATEEERLLWVQTKMAEKGRKKSIVTIRRYLKNGKSSDHA